MENPLLIRQNQCVPAMKLTQQRFAVVGVGSVGREIAMELASMGAEEIHLFDFDNVERRNLVNQHYRDQDVGYSKVSACKLAMEEVMLRDTGQRIFSHDVRFNDMHAMEIQPTVVFCAVDNIDSRKVIYSNWKLIEADDKILIDSRVGGETFRVINVMPHDTHYQAELFPPEETFDGPCAEQLTIYMSRITAGFAVAQMAMWLRGFHLDKIISVNVLGCDVDRS